MRINKRLGYRMVEGLGAWAFASLREKPEHSSQHCRILVSLHGIFAHEPAIKLDFVHLPRQATNPTGACALVNGWVIVWLKVQAPGPLRA